MRILGIILLFSFLFQSCKKQDTTWDTDYSIPLMKANLGISDLVNDTLISNNPNGSLNLIFKGNLFQLDLNELLEIKDTTLINSTIIPFTLPLNPNDVILNSVEKTNYNFDQVALRLAIIKEGQLQFEGTNTLLGEIRIKYTIPKMLKDGQAFEVIMDVPGRNTNGGKIFRTFDVSGYTLDLTGISGNVANEIEYRINASVSPNASQFQAEVNESLVFKTTFKGIKPRYAKGTFGQRPTQNVSDSSRFDAFSKLIDGQLDMQEFSLSMKIINGIGADARLKLNKLAGENFAKNTVSLNHEIIGKTLNIERAVDNLNGNPQVIEKSYQYDFTPSNSNFVNFFENLPSKLLYDFDLEINPLGDVSGGNDFINSDHTLKLDLDLEAPLNFSATNLTFVDTTALNIENTENIDPLQEAKIFINANNSFPFALTLNIDMLDENNQNKGNLFNNLNIEAADLDINTGKTIGLKTSKLMQYIGKENIEAIKSAKKLVIKIKINTFPSNQLLEIYQDYQINLDINADFKYKMKIK